MAYLKIKLGVGKYSESGRVVHPKLYQPGDEIKEAVLARDDHTCRYCGFRSPKYQEIQYTGEGLVPKMDPRKLMVADNYATTCTFCHQCFHLEKIEYMQSGTVIWLPEIGQAALHHIVRAIYVARLARGPVADAAKDALDALTSRKEEAVARLGTDSPAVLSSILKDFLEVKEYQVRLNKLKGFKVLPLDRRIIKEGDLEFNQFPQVLAYWRSKDGPFAALPARDWEKMFADFVKQTR